MAHSLELEVIAEGVETADQWNFLRSQGCDQIQGYYVSQPVAANAFARFLETERFHA
jgi:EAL domain-containing protein (putative c-di-GMP-specific phosphodiesterase class I)